MLEVRIYTAQEIAKLRELYTIKKDFEARIEEIENEILHIYWEAERME